MRNANVGPRRLEVQDTHITVLGTRLCKSCNQLKPYNRTSLKNRCRGFIYAGENNLLWYGRVCPPCRAKDLRRYYDKYKAAKDAAKGRVDELLGPEQPEFVARKRSCTSCGAKTVNRFLCPQCNIQDDGVISHTDLNSYGRL